MEAWQSPEIFALWLTVALLVVILLVLSIVLFTRSYYKRIQAEQSMLTEAKLNHQKDLLQTSALVQEQERQRIASDLHDALIPELSSILFIDNFPETIREKLQSGIQLARGISHDLSPPLLQESDIFELTEEFVHSFRTAYTIELYQSESKQSAITNENKLQLFRIIQEVILNIVKHACADHIHIHLRESSKYWCMLIKDNGNGFDPDKVRPGLGLKSIEFRSFILTANYRYQQLEKGNSFMLCYTHANNDHQRTKQERENGKN